jgi:hypothetical protein
MTGALHQVQGMSIRISTRCNFSFESMIFALSENQTSDCTMKSQYLGALGKRLLMCDSSNRI